jgi:AraC-like DNA-binding protein
VPVDERSALAAASARRILESRGRVRVRELAADFGVGERRLQRAFEHAVGLTPKRLARVARLQAAARCLHHGGDPLVEVAAKCGYADQSHFTHEFRELTGLAPGAFAAERHGLAEAFTNSER